MTPTRLAALSLLVLLACRKEEAPPPPPKLVVALKPDKNPDQMLAEKQALSTFLAGKLGRPVEVIVPLGASVILEGMAGGSIDLGYVSSTDMRVALEKKLATVLLVGEIDGKTRYQGYWVARKGAPYTKVEDLRGKPIAFASRTSTSGYLVPFAGLVRTGLLQKGEQPEAFFGPGNVHFATGYVSAIDQLLRGEVEAAAVSDYVLDKDRHLTAEQRAQLTLLAVSGDVPTHVLAVRASLPPEEARDLASALHALGKENPELRNKVFTSPLVEANAAEHLAPIEEALQLVQVVP